MVFEEAVKSGNLRIGTKQTIKQVELGNAAEVYVAQDADPRMIHKIVNICKKHGVLMTSVASMKLLGKACGIEVGAAMAVRLKD